MQKKKTYLRWHHSSSINDPNLSGGVVRWSSSHMYPDEWNLWETLTAVFNISFLNQSFSPKEGPNMVHVYNCHPFSTQQIVQVGGTWLTLIPCALWSAAAFTVSSLLSLSVAQVEREPGLVCCGGGALFVVATGGCKVAYKLMFTVVYIFKCVYSYYLHTHYVSNDCGGSKAKEK